MSAAESAEWLALISLGVSVFVLLLIWLDD